VYCQSEDNQFTVISFENPTAPQIISCVYVDGLADFIVLGKDKVVLVGKQIVFFNIST